RAGERGETLLQSQEAPRMWQRFATALQQRDVGAEPHLLLAQDAIDLARVRTADRLQTSPGRGLKLALLFHHGAVSARDGRLRLALRGVMHGLECRISAAGNPFPLRSFQPGARAAHCQNLRATA